MKGGAGCAVFSASPTAIVLSGWEIETQTSRSHARFSNLWQAAASGQFVQQLLFTHICHVFVFVKLGCLGWLGQEGEELKKKKLTDATDFSSSSWESSYLAYQSNFHLLIPDFLRNGRYGLT